MTEVGTFTDDNFQSTVLNNDQVVLVDFWAPWCGPCRAVGPTIDELAAEHGQKVTIGKLNVDDNQATAASLGITSIPAVLLFSGGQVVDTLIGVQSKETYERALQAVP